MQFLRRRSALVILAVAAFSAIGACGGVHHQQERPLPRSAGYDTFRPNFLGDLKNANYWPKQEVLCGLPAPGEARWFDGSNLPNQQISDAQAAAVVEALRRWSEGSNVPGPGEKTHERRIVFRKAEAGETPDFIVVVQDDDRFDANVLGVCSWWLRDKASGALGGAIIRIRASQSGRAFLGDALHEAGHLWGADGHDRKVGQVMSPNIRPLAAVDRLADRDKNSISANYTRDVTRAYTVDPAQYTGEFESIDCRAEDM